MAQIKPIQLPSTLTRSGSKGSTALAQTSADLAHEATVRNDEMNRLIIDAIQDKKGQNVALLDMRHLDDRPADFFIVCEGTSNTQVKAIADNIEFELKDKAGIRPGHIEGERNAVWILMDYFNTVVHVFHPETRFFYQLELLWGDAKLTQFAEL